jgi:hypothetical protein
LININFLIPDMPPHCDIDILRLSQASRTVALLLAELTPSEVAPRSRTN